MNQQLEAKARPAQAGREKVWSLLSSVANGCSKGWILHPTHDIFYLEKYALVETSKVSYLPGLLKRYIMNSKNDTCSTTGKPEMSLLDDKFLIL